MKSLKAFIRLRAYKRISILSNDMPRSSFLMKKQRLIKSYFKPILLKALKTRRFTKFNNLLQQIFIILSTAEYQFFLQSVFFCVTQSP